MLGDELCNVGCDIGNPTQICGGNTHTTVFYSGKYEFSYILWCNIFNNLCRKEQCFPYIHLQCILYYTCFIVLGANCSLPPDVDFAYQYNVTSLQYNTLHNYTCVAGYEFPGGNLSAWVRCNETQMWDPVLEPCKGKKHGCHGTQSAQLHVILILFCQCKWV